MMGAFYGRYWVPSFVSVGINGSGLIQSYGWVGSITQIQHKHVFFEKKKHILARTDRAINGPGQDSTLFLDVS
jgi:hypothetical protein